MSNYKKDDRKEAHFTPNDLIDEMFSLLNKYYKGDITEYLENSAGDGRIIDRFDKPYIAFDIESRRDDIKECDYLKEKIEYKPGRVALINPPFQKGLKFLYNILEWLDLSKKIGGLQYLSKPLPPFSPKKIIIKHKDKK